MNISNEVMFTQMSAKAGIKKFGETAISATLDEFNQLDKGANPGYPVVTNTHRYKKSDCGGKRKTLPA